MKNRIYIVLLSLFVLMCSCKKTQTSEIAGPDEYFTCSMDPQVIENKPGNCPICHMRLIKVKKNNLKEGQIRLSEQQIKLGNILFDTLQYRQLAKEIILTGKVTVNQNTTVAISSKTAGRIDKLYIKNSGEYISNGQILYEIYSEDLAISQREYISALNNNSTFAEAAKSKLLLSGMTSKQIQQLENSKQPLSTIPVYAEHEGYVTEVLISEGNYVSMGTTICKIADVRFLWVETQVYLPYLSFLKLGTIAAFSVPGSGDKDFSGKVIFIEPQVQTPNRFVLARFELSNPDLSIKPGMLAQIRIQTDYIKCLAVPIDAVIENSAGPSIWVRNPNGTFENKMVQTGLQNGREIEIKTGLHEGEMVVVSGAYLLNSEYVFKKGANPMTGHGHKNNEEESSNLMPGMQM